MTEELVASRGGFGHLTVPLKRHEHASKLIITDDSWVCITFHKNRLVCFDWIVCGPISPRFEASSVNPMWSIGPRHGRLNLHSGQSSELRCQDKFALFKRLAGLWHVAFWD
ncbi:unnamed protein product [Protopolystoma xenopodis]|uniref:Uncharacterized protein n=1 Tax=Protopolystoma xenopodis TaxID=117903 RepID=A0A3S5C6J7_9PLAT|nr:unnamed protein product [Protopolystoma xenopodis]